MTETAEHLSLQLTDATFKPEVTNFAGLVLVDFWAEWCHPCLVMGPWVEELAAKFAGNSNVKIAKLNVDENEETTMSERVMSLPTFKLFKGGQVIDEVVGTTSLEALTELINRNMPAIA